VFVLLLFVLFSLGLAGMCSRRMHNSYKQTCHRGKSARFFLTAIALFFLFSWVLIIVATVLYIPGIMVRQAICKPLIELEDNQLFVVCTKKKKTFCLNTFKNWN
jgi:hypothetical protein